MGMGIGTGGIPTTDNIPETTEKLESPTDNIPETTEIFAYPTRPNLIGSFISWQEMKELIQNG